MQASFACGSTAAQKAARHDFFAVGQVDNFNQLRVSAYVTAAHIKFLLLHDGKSEDAIKSFFKDVYEVYLKVRWQPCITEQAGFGLKSRWMLDEPKHMPSAGSMPGF